MFTKITPLTVLSTINDINSFLNNDETLIKFKKSFDEKFDSTLKNTFKDRDYPIYVEIAGFTKEDLTITFNEVDSLLTITGSIKTPYEKAVTKTYTVDSTKYEIGKVKLENGLLQIDVKLKEEVKGQDIKIAID